MQGLDNKFALATATGIVALLTGVTAIKGFEAYNALVEYASQHGHLATGAAATAGSTMYVVPLAVLLGVTADLYEKTKDTKK